MAGSPAPRACAFLLAVPLLFAAVLGIGALVGPDTIEDGNPITISVSGVTDGYILNTTLTATYLPSPGVEWLNLTNWKYPFALGNGSVMVRGQNVNLLTLLVQTGGTVRTGRDTGTGNITKEIFLDVPAATTQDIRIAYKVHKASDPMVFTVFQHGTKAGTAEEALLTPSITGISEGDLSVQVLANDTLLASKEIRVLGAAPPPVPTTEVTVIAPSPSPAQPAPALIEATPSLPAPIPSESPSSSPSPTPVPATPQPPATTRPLPVRTPPHSPAATPSPGPASPGTPFPWIMGYAAVIIVIAPIADYLFMKD
jgi:hypothetical protein